MDSDLQRFPVGKQNVRVANFITEVFKELVNLLFIGESNTITPPLVTVQHWSSLQGKKSHAVLQHAVSKTI